jgi:hypothetical protein
MNYKDNYSTHFYIIMTVTLSLATVMGDNKIDDAKNKGKLLAFFFTG